MDLMQPMIAKRMQDFPTWKILLFKEFSAPHLDVALEVASDSNCPRPRPTASTASSTPWPCRRDPQAGPGTRWWKGSARARSEEFFYSHIPAKRHRDPRLFSVLWSREKQEECDAPPMRTS